MIKHGEVKRLRILATELEDVADFNCTINYNRGLALWALISCTNLSGFNVCIDCEVATIDNVSSMSVLLVCAGYPRSSWSYTRICINGKSVLLSILWSKVSFNKDLEL